jgi:hypothetical protein
MGNDLRACVGVGGEEKCRTKVITGFRNRLIEGTNEIEMVGSHVILRWIHYLVDLRLDVEVGNSLEDIAPAVEFVDAVRHVTEGLQRCDEAGQETEVCVGDGGFRDDVAERHRE